MLDQKKTVNDVIIKLLNRYLGARLLFARKLSEMNQQSFAKEIGVGREVYKACENNIYKECCNAITDDVAAKAEKLAKIPPGWMLHCKANTSAVFRKIGFERSIRIGNGILFMLERKKLGMTKAQMATAVKYANSSYICKIEAGEYGVPTSLKPHLDRIGVDTTKIAFGQIAPVDNKNAVIKKDVLKKAIAMKNEGIAVSNIYALLKLKDQGIKYNTFFQRLGREIKKLKESNNEQN